MNCDQTELRVDIGGWKATKSQTPSGSAAHVSVTPTSISPTLSSGRLDIEQRVSSTEAASQSAGLSGGSDHSGPWGQRIGCSFALWSSFVIFGCCSFSGYDEVESLGCLQIGQILFTILLGLISDQLLAELLDIQLKPTLQRHCIGDWHIKKVFSKNP